MKNSMKSVVVLVCICVVSAVLLAMTNSITGPIIEKNEQNKSNEALLEVLPDAKSFEKIDITSYTLPATVVEAYSADNGGHVVKLNTTGYAQGLMIMCGISSEGKVVAAKVLASGETPNIGGVALDGMANKVAGADVEGIDLVDTVAGATKSTLAYRNAIKDALNTVVILGGGSVDLRDEAQILNDNLSAALPEANGEFTKHFFVEVVEGIDAIYTANNNAGAVCVIGDKFIATDAEGKVITECTPEEAATVEAAIAIINATTLESVDLSLYDGLGLPSQLVSVQKTASGNYVIEIKGAGYGITGGNEYHPASGEYIYIRVSMTASGEIIDCYTISQKETDGIGSACADEKFYGQFDGKTEENYNDVDAIAGATLTTDGYKKAIGRAFQTVKILESATSGEAEEN